VHLLEILIRYLSSLIFAGVLTLLLFLVMQQMLSFEWQKNLSISVINELDFVQLNRDHTPTRKKITTKPPEKPQLPKKKAPPPKLQKLQVDKPQIESIDMPVPRLQAKLNLNDALYLGSFQKQSVVKQAIQIDEDVVPLVRIAPIYPSRAARLNIEGWVKLEVLIDSFGTVKKAKVLKSHPSGIFNQAAIRAVKRWRFRPKVVDGIAVSRAAEQQINFILHK